MSESLRQPCRWCGKLNRLKEHPEQRCSRCRLILAGERHHKWNQVHPDSYIHPLDRQALQALRAIPGVDMILRKLLELTQESYFRTLLMAQAVQVSGEQYPELDILLTVVCQTLGLPRPELYVTLEDPFGGGMSANAFTIGAEHPLIVMHAPLLERLTPEETLAVLAHEVGHIHCQHMLYHTAARVLGMAMGMLGKTIGGMLEMVGTPIRLALMAWYQKAELSCDRTALLVVQDARVVTSALMKICGAAEGYTLDLDSFIAQAKRFDERNAENLFNRVWSTVLAAKSSHPFPVWRVGELLSWAEQTDEKSYAAVLKSLQVWERA
jgi:Zn-dependent protease with chaperone function